MGELIDVDEHEFLVCCCLGAVAEAKQRQPVGFLGFRCWQQKAGKEMNTYGMCVCFTWAKVIWASFAACWFVQPMCTRPNRIKPVDHHRNSMICSPVYIFSSLYLFIYLYRNYYYFSSLYSFKV